jgi:DNA polymerase-3 subunit chi
MPEVVFVTGVVDLIETARTLVRRKHRESARTAVFGPPDRLRELDRALWAVDPQDFLPHVHVPAGAAPHAHQTAWTPIWLLERPVEGLGCESAINLGLDDPSPLLSFERVAELIGTSPADREAGRRRWKRYESQGFSLKHHAQ